MSNTNRYAWTWEIKNECLDEYVRMHLEPWPEIMKEHSAAGIRDFSIFQNANQFFYFFECDDLEKAFEYLSRSEACQRWNAITSEMVKGSFDFAEENPIEFLQEVFRLD
jgi:L-rhamnose mutarotase